MSPSFINFSYLSNCKSLFVWNIDDYVKYGRLFWYEFGVLPALPWKNLRCLSVLVIQDCKKHSLPIRGGTSREKLLHLFRVFYPLYKLNPGFMQLQTFGNNLPD